MARDMCHLWEDGALARQILERDATSPLSKWFEAEIKAEHKFFLADDQGKDWCATKTPSCLAKVSATTLQLDYPD